MATIIFPDIEGLQTEIEADHFDIVTKNGVKIRIFCVPDDAGITGDIRVGVFEDEQTLVVRPCCSNNIAISVEKRSFRDA
ncbi:hypothetical protein [Phyllobacterium leguminum]|nr:hypothetical protein [Phyllobacterium leguminum]